jgi:hypothetical protein
MLFEEKPLVDEPSVRLGFRRHAGSLIRAVEPWHDDHQYIYTTPFGF